MKIRMVLLLILCAVLAMAGIHPVQADGIIIPDVCLDCPAEPWVMNQLSIRYHHVTVNIEGQIAVTHVDQVFANPNTWDVEGVYVFPLPADAVVSDFRLWMDGEPVQARILDAAEARQTYEEIVNEMRDPALLEYVGQGAVQASIYPIPAGGESRIELEYIQPLTADNGLVRYTYPLNTEKFSTTPLESVTVRVEITSTQNIRAVYSPSHAITVDQVDALHAAASYEAVNVLPTTDFTLVYSLGESEAMHLLSYRDPSDTSDPDGYFLLLLAPGLPEATRIVEKDVLLVLDQSGSMEGEKFQQAQQAARYILQHLNPRDRFYISAFNTSVQAYADGMSDASDAQGANRWVDGLSAGGATNIELALLEAAAMAGNERPTYLIFMTDGLPTDGVQVREDILKDFNARAPSGLRLFTFGVGYDVDTLLLDSLAGEHGGVSTYVEPGEALDESLSEFYGKISAPVLTGLQLDFGSLHVYDIYPDPLPDIFAGSQVVVVGRYEGGGVVQVTASGMADGVETVFGNPHMEFATDSRDGNGFLSGLPRLWAARKIGYLLNRERLYGSNEESIEQIIRLSLRHGIVTPYTSYLVEETMPLTGGGVEELANDAYLRGLAEPTAAASGAAAVGKSEEEGELMGAPAPPGEAGVGNMPLRMAGARTFVLLDGVWVDTSFDRALMPLRQVEFLSAEYYELAGQSPEVAAALALGRRVLLVVDGGGIEIVEEGAAVLPTGQGATRTTTPGVGVGGSATPAATHTPTLLPLDDAEPPVSGARVANPGWLLAGMAGCVLAAGFWLARGRKSGG